MEAQHRRLEALKSIVGILDDTIEAPSVRPFAKLSQLAIFKVRGVGFIFSHIPGFHQAVEHLLPVSKQVVLQLPSSRVPAELDGNGFDETGQPRQAREKFQPMHAVHAGRADILPDTAKESGEKHQ
jgi:hypothetical protein